METLGQLLRKSREARGLSIEDIHRSTRINMPMLKALEENQLEKLPAPVIARGFIRSYCKVVGLDETTALEMYDQEVGPHDLDLIERLNLGESGHSMKWLIICALLAVVIVGIILFLLSS